MIGKLRGRIDSIAEDHLIMDVGGVGYVVFASPRTLGQIQGISGEVALVIETHVREDHIHLYGFPGELERDWFRLLFSVQGVGAKMALSVLGLFSPEELANVIAAQDVTALTRAPGIGKKLAERIVVELKTKAGKLPVAFAAPAFAAGGRAGGKTTPPGGGSVQQDAVSALVNLGYTRSDAFAAVARAMQDGEDGMDGIIRASLQLLAA